MDNCKRSADAWMRRHAVAIVAQLPESPAEATRILEYALELIDTFMSGRAAGELPQRVRKSQAVLELLESADSAASASSNIRRMP